jgi:hypothetical protein
MQSGTSLTGKDPSGRAAVFRHYITSQEFNWELRSSSNVQLNGAGGVEEFLRYLRSDGVQAQLREGSDGLIAVGTASEEGAEARETERARARANALVSWIHQTFPERVDLYALTLGQHDGCARARRAPHMQRRVMLIAVLEKAAGMSAADVEHALKNALRGDPAFPDLHCYSRFELTPHSIAH